MHFSGKSILLNDVPKFGTSFLRFGQHERKNLAGFVQLHKTEQTFA